MEDPNWNIYENKRIRLIDHNHLGEEHKGHFVDLFGIFSHETRQGVVDSLQKTFEGFNIKNIVVREFVLHECN